MHLIAANSLGTEDSLDAIFLYIQFLYKPLYMAFIVHIQHMNFPSTTAGTMEEKKVTGQIQMWYSLFCHSLLDILSTKACDM